MSNEMPCVRRAFTGRSFSKGPRVRCLFQAGTCGAGPGRRAGLLQKRFSQLEEQLVDFGYGQFFVYGKYDSRISFIAGIENGLP